MISEPKESNKRERVNLDELAKEKLSSRVIAAIRRLTILKGGSWVLRVKWGRIDLIIMEPHEEEPGDDPDRYN